MTEDLLLEQNKGMIRTAQILDVGITKTVFYRYAKERELEQIAHGIYASADAWLDAMYLLHLRFGQIVFSHDTALFFHDLVRSRNSIEIQTLQGALKQYARHKEKNLRKLMQYATAFHVEKILRQYLEVLL